jgi:hypothetical protein
MCRDEFKGRGCNFVDWMYVAKDTIQLTAVNTVINRQNARQFGVYLFSACCLLKSQLSKLSSEWRTKEQLPAFRHFLEVHEMLESPGQ